MALDMAVSNGFPSDVAIPPMGNEIAAILAAGNSKPAIGSDIMGALVQMMAHRPEPSSPAVTNTGGEGSSAGTAIVAGLSGLATGLGAAASLASNKPAAPQPVAATPPQPAAPTPPETPPNTEPSKPETPKPAPAKRQKKPAATPEPTPEKKVDDTPPPTAPNAPQPPASSVPPNVTDTLAAVNDAAKAVSSIIT